MLHYFSSSLYIVFGSVHTTGSNRRLRVLIFSLSLLVPCALGVVGGPDPNRQKTATACSDTRELDCALSVQKVKGRANAAASSGADPAQFFSECPWLISWFAGSILSNRQSGL
jgi:hypothetical protein